MWRKVLNPFMIWLLQSPFHYLVSQHIMLISVRGRKTSTTYTTPVEYGMDNDAVYVITGQRYTWWKNLRGGNEAELLIKGKLRSGRAQINSDSQTILDTFRKIYPNRNGFERVAPGCVAIRINLTA